MSKKDVSKFPPGLEEYMREIAPGRRSDEIAAMVREHFDIEFTTSQCTAYKKNHKITSGLDTRFKPGCESHNKGVPMNPTVYEKCRRTMFKSGNTPMNQAQIGEIRKTNDGYLIKKVSMTGAQWERWKFLHRIVWEEANGPVPEGGIVIFLDGNKENCAIENLMLIDKKTNAIMNKKGLRNEEPDITESGAIWAKLINELNNKKKKERQR